MACKILKLSQQSTNDRGSVLVVFALMVVVFVLLAGFSVDSSNMSYVKQELQHAADEALLATVNAVNKDPGLLDPDPSPADRDNRGETLIESIFMKNLESRGLDSTHLAGPPAINATMEPDGILRITASMAVRTFFMQLAQFGSVNARATSELRLSEVTPPTVVVFLQDITTLNTEEERNGIQDALAFLISKLKPGDWIAAVTYHKTYYDDDDHPPDTGDWATAGNWEYRNIWLDMTRISSIGHKNTLMTVEANNFIGSRDSSYRVATSENYGQGGIHMARQMIQRAVDTINTGVSPSAPYQPSNRYKKWIVIGTNGKWIDSSRIYSTNNEDHKRNPGDTGWHLPFRRLEAGGYRQVQLNFKKTCNNYTGPAYAMISYEADLARQQGTEVFVVCTDYCNQGIPVVRNEWDSIMKRVSWDNTLEKNIVGGKPQWMNLLPDWAFPHVGQSPIGQWNEAHPVTKNAKHYCGGYDNSLLAESGCSCLDKSCRDTYPTWCNKKRYFKDSTAAPGHNARSFKRNLEELFEQEENIRESN